MFLFWLSKCLEESEFRKVYKDLHVVVGVSNFGGCAVNPKKMGGNVKMVAF